MHILPCPEKLSQILELEPGFFSETYNDQVHDLSLSAKSCWGFIFNVAQCLSCRELCNSCGLWCRGYLDRTGSRRSRSCWIHSPQHHFDGLGTPRRALKSRSDGKGQQALSISKAWAKAQPFIHYWGTGVTMQPFSVEHSWPRPLSIVLISMKSKHIPRIRHFFACCPQEREFPQVGPNMYFVRGIFWPRRSPMASEELWRDIFNCSKSCFVFGLSKVTWKCVCVNAQGKIRPRKKLVIHCGSGPATVESDWVLPLISVGTGATCLAILNE